VVSKGWVPRSEVRTAVGSLTMYREFFSGLCAAPFDADKLTAAQPSALESAFFPIVYPFWPAGFDFPLKVSLLRKRFRFDQPDHCRFNLLTGKRFCKQTVDVLLSDLYRSGVIAIPGDKNF